MSGTKAKQREVERREAEQRKAKAKAKAKKWGEYVAVQRKKTKDEKMRQERLEEEDTKAREKNARALAIAKGFEVHAHPYKSISVFGLEMLVKRLPKLSFFHGKEIDHISSNDIRAFLLAGNPHPAWIFPEYFSEDPPDAALTYEWKLFFQDIFSYLNSKQIEQCGRKWKALIKNDMKQLRIWIDVLFINQLSTDIGQMLLMAQDVYSCTEFHLMLVTSTVFTRAWCLFELAVRRLADRETLPVESARVALSRNVTSSGNFYSGMAASQEQDLVLIRAKIDEAFGKRFDMDLKPVFLAAGGVLI